MEDPREVAAFKYKSGNKYSGTNKPEGFELSIRYYIDALSALCDIPDKERTQKDTQDIRDILSGLLKTMNKLIKFSLETPTFSRWDFVLNAVENFLGFYVTYVRVFNKTRQRLPGLDELNYASVELLLEKASSEPHKKRIEIYLAFIKLFRDDFVSPAVFVESNESVVKKARELYQRALISETKKCVAVVERCPVVSPQNSKETLTFLIHAINRLMKLSNDWVPMLEKLLTFYVNTLAAFTEKQQELPGLNGLDRTSAVNVCRYSSSKTERDRAKTCLAVLSFFQDDMKAEDDFQLDSQDPLVIEVFKLYVRARGEYHKTLQVDEPPVAVVAAEPKEKRAKSEKKVRFFQPSEEVNTVRKVKKELRIDRRFPELSFALPDPPKRKVIDRLMRAEEYETALLAFPCMMDRSGAEHRAERMCQEKIGMAHFAQKKLSLTLKCYREALDCCTHLRQDSVVDEVLEEDRVYVVSVFRRLVQTLNELTKNWSRNFAEASQCMDDFLDFYLNNFIFYKGDKTVLLRLDEVEMGNLIPTEITQVYLIIIAMFREVSRLVPGQLVLEIDKIKALKNSEIGQTRAFSLFERALDIMLRTQRREILNPEIRVLPKPKKKWGESSSSSSFPPYGLQQSPPRVVPKSEPQSPPSPGNSLAHSN